MSEIICVTNRLLCKDDFLTRLEMIVQNRPKAVILREKELSPQDYKMLAEKVMRICGDGGVTCILHSFADVAAELNAHSIHLPLHILRQLTDGRKRQFKTIGCSCHSVEEAREAEALGASYLIAGHVFVTDCKKGLAPRGLDFLGNVCGSVGLPVYAIGGIDRDNIGSVMKVGAAGACIMSGFMRCADVDNFVMELTSNGDKT